MKTIAIVDDDKNISELMGLYLQKAGYKTIFYGSAIGLYQAIYKEKIDLIVLDLMMPGMTGFEFLESAAKGQIPVIVVSAKGRIEDRIKGLNIGADDYLVKPFDGQELVARVEAILRRVQGQNPLEAIVYPGLSVNIHKHEVVYKSQALLLPHMEINLLYFLVGHANQVFTREQLMVEVWGQDYDSDYRTVDVHIKRLRGRFDGTDPWQIKTVWGVGYKFEIKEGL